MQSEEKKMPCTSLISSTCNFICSSVFVVNHVFILRQFLLSDLKLHKFIFFIIVMKYKLTNVVLRQYNFSTGVLRLSRCASSTTWKESRHSLYIWHTANLT